mgnify:CR=1 FL=1
MANKLVKTRIQNKHDIEANWNNASFVPYAGELIIYDPDSTYSYPRFKIGDGTRTVGALPFMFTLQSGGDITVSSTGVVTVKDDSHAHVISNVDGLQTKLDGIDDSLADLDASLTALDANKAAKTQGIFYIEGGGTTDTTNKVATWTGTHSGITSYYAGLVLAYKIGTAGSTKTTLNINDLGAVTVVKNATTAISTNFAVDSVILLVYTVDSSGTAYWKAHDYDSNTKTTTGTSNKASTKLFLAGATSQTSSGTTTYSNKNVYIGTDNHLYSNAKRVLNTDDKEACEAALAGHTHGNATATTPGFMSADDKAKLDGAQWLAEEPAEDSLFWEGTVSKGISSTWGTLSKSLTLTLGVCYKVYWNNVPYTCATYYAGGQVCLGAASLASTSHAASNENAPFVFFGIGTTGSISTVITESAITDAIPVKIYTTNVTYLPNQYLPLADTNPGAVKSGGSVTITNGLISISDASTSKKGIVQLSSATNSTSTSLAATASAVKAAYDLANTANAAAVAAANQNAFSNVKVGDTTVAADTTTDTLTLVAGSNITITPDATNDKITITATDTNTHNSHAVISGKKADGSTDITGATSSGNITLGDSGVTAGEYGPTANATPGYGATFNVPDIKVNAKGIVTSVTNRTVKIPASDNTNTTYDLAATKSSTNGNVKLNLTAGGSGSGTDSVTLKGTGATTVTTDANGIVTINSTAHPTALKNPNALTIGGKSYDGSAAVSVSAADLGISNAVHFIGETTTALTDGTTTAAVTISGASKTPTAGDVVLYGSKEFIWTGSAWKELGDGSSFALKGHGHAASDITSGTLAADRLPTASSSTLGGVKIGSNISISSGKISVPTADGTTAGVTVVYPAASCTTFSSDSGTVTPAAVQKGAKMFAITRPSASTTNAVTRYSNTTGDVKDSKITIEDVTNTKDTSKKANVLVIPAEGGKKMVYGYCTDQTDGTSFIGGVFDASATTYPYASGLAIGGTSGNLLWKGKRVLDNDDLTTINNSISGKAGSSHAHGNITSSGTITSTAVSSATGVLVYDSSNKIQRATAANARSIIGAAPSYDYSTTDLTAGSSTLTTGKLYFVYE